ncbi:hypothetical protein F4824DRAFT_478682, partial [Ustulina deusta]
MKPGAHLKNPSENTDSGRFQSLPSAPTGPFYHRGGPPTSAMPGAAPQVEHELSTFAVEIYDYSPSWISSRQDGNDTIRLESSESSGSERAGKPTDTTSKSPQHCRPRFLISYCCRWARFIFAILKFYSIFYFNGELERDDLFLFDVMAMISVILRDLKEIIAPGGRVHVNNLFSVSILSEGILFASLLALFLFDISLLVKFRRGPYQHRNEPYNTFRYGLWELYSVAIPRILRTLILVVASWVPALTLSMAILYYIIGD